MSEVDMFEYDAQGDAGDSERVLIVLSDTGAMVNDDAIELSAVEVESLRAFASQPGVFLDSRKIHALGYALTQRADSLSVTLKSLAEKLNTEEDVIRSIGTTFVARYMLELDVSVTEIEGPLPKITPREYKIKDKYWRDKANCLSEDPNVFTDASGRGVTKLIQTFCGSCAVRSDCLAAAVIVGDTVGVKGGLGGAKRRPHIKAHKKYLKDH